MLAHIQQKLVGSVNCICKTHALMDKHQHALGKYITVF